MKVLFIGDVFSKPGRNAVVDNVAKIKKEENIDLVIVNAENATHGKGISKDHYNELKNAGCNVLTFGNHCWACKEIYELLEKNKDLVRPYNITECNEQVIGSGSILINVCGKSIRVTNLLGQNTTRKFPLFNAFDAIDEIIEHDRSDIHILDFHAETTSEKAAMFNHVKERVSAVIGTHTHVQTADERIESGTAFITDVGMTGPYNSVIGAETNSVVNFFTNRVQKFKLLPAKGLYQFCAIIIEFNSETNKPISIKRIKEIETE